MRFDNAEDHVRATLLAGSPIGRNVLGISPVTAHVGTKSGFDGVIFVTKEKTGVTGEIANHYWVAKLLGEAAAKRWRQEEPSRSHAAAK